jgi:hypothetical protein
MLKKNLLPIAIFGATICIYAQDKLENRNLDYYPDKFKIIPDKVFEMGVPLLFLFFVIQALLAFAKMRAENQLKLKIIEKGVSEETLVEVFKESNVIARLQPLKWFLFASATGLALMIIHFSRDYLVNESGYFAVGLILLLNAAAFAVYYNILTRKNK